jgi:serine protease Do
MKRLILNGILSLVFGLTGAYLFQNFNSNSQENTISLQDLRATLVNYNGTATEQSLNFVLASKVSTPSVVFIKTTSMVRQRNPFGFFFDGWDPFGSIGQVSSTGSGVIVRKDGYIVTNLHVINDAQTIEVVLNNKKKTYKATLVGTDPSTDLALLKIEADSLPAIAIADSDQLEIGEWVVAVGNPFNLTSTVTAGIVSAKGRNINVVNNQFPIESFIQTDAAINPGNSGGALVNLNGELVGINTAIFSKTGSYTGYGFAIPANIVSKSVKDLIDFGEIQRGYHGMEIDEITENSERINKTTNGALVLKVYPDGPATKAGLLKDDIIVKIQNKAISGKSSFDENMSYYRPGDKLKINVIRSGSEKELTLTLTNLDGETSIRKRHVITSVKLGASFEALSKVELQKYRIQNGVKVTQVSGGLIGSMNIEEGFIFVKYNGQACINPEDLVKQLENAGGRMQIEGVGADGGSRIYNFYY